ncbi:MAG: Gfo/Idh/MocA family protein [Candidatus Sumerlaeaceae bacterium]
MSLRVGIVGCGAVAGIHIRGYRACDGVQVVACSDISLERAQKFAVEKEIPSAYASFIEMFEAEKLDAISVCTPNYAHCEPTVEALQRGMHVLCEKPIAMNSEEAQKMVNAARTSKRMLTIGHHMRFLPVCQFLKRMIEQGELGHIYYGRSHALRRRGVPGWGQFHIKSKSGGGPLIDLGVHTLDLIIWLMGSPRPKCVSGSVYTQFGNRQTFYNPHGTYRREDYDVEDFACGMVKFTDGCTLSLEASWAAHLKDEEIYPQTILGDLGGAELLPFTTPKAPTSVRIFQSRDEALINLEPTAFVVVDAHVEELKHWVKCLRGEAEVLVRGEESLNVQRILDSIYLSSQEGREILIEEVHELSGEGSGRVGSNLELAPAAVEQ